MERLSLCGKDRRSLSCGIGRVGRIGDGPGSVILKLQRMHTLHSLWKTNGASYGRRVTQICVMDCSSIVSPMDGERPVGCGPAVGVALLLIAELRLRRVTHRLTRLTVFTKVFT